MAIPTPQYFAMLHCLLPVNGGARENWPRAGLEAFAAGCPVVGVRTRAPFIHDGVTGVFVERLPPGATCVKNDADEMALAAYFRAVQAL